MKKHSFLQIMQKSKAVNQRILLYSMSQINAVNIVQIWIVHKLIFIPIFVKKSKGPFLDYKIPGVIYVLMGVI